MTPAATPQLERTSQLEPALASAASYLHWHLCSWATHRDCCSTSFSRCELHEELLAHGHNHKDFYT